MRNIAIIILTAVLAILTCQPAATAQSVYENKVEFDKTVHDFGDISESDGAVSCTYTVKNTGSKAMIILNVVSSCGCTSVSWTREPIAPGKTGTVSATFDNNDGPYPFDKTLTVYISDLAKPVILHLRGTVHKASRPLKERYTLMFGNFGVRELEMNAGAFSAGQRKTVTFTIANNGITPMKVDFQNVTPGMTLKVYPNPVPAQSTATLECTISAGRNYGKNWYYASPVVDGRPYKAVGRIPAAEDDGSHIYKEANKRLGLGKSEFGVYGVIKPVNYENQDKTTSDIMFTKSTQSFGKVPAGSTAEVSYEFNNGGKLDLEIFKVDAECSNVKVSSMDAKVAPGKKGTLKIALNTSGMPRGENIIVLNLYTNSTHRPVVTLQLVGEIQ